MPLGITVPFLNPGFEADLSQGWESLGDVSRPAVDSSFAASSGSCYANLTSSGASRGDIELFLGVAFDSKYTNGSALRQSVQVTAGQTFSFDWKFLESESDSTYYNDAAFAISGASAQILSSASVAGATQEGRYEYTFQSSGEYVIGLAVFNAQDFSVHAVLKVDDFSLDGEAQTAAVSENESPVLADAGSTLAYMEGDGAKVVDSSLTLTDTDNTNIESATITISSGFQSSEDLLAFTNANGITGSWDASNGILTLTGSATKAQYEQALESITYTNTNTDNPNTTSRTISWVVNDSDSNSTAVTSTITVARVNDAPAAASKSLTIEEDQPYVFSVSDFGFTDVDGDSLKAIRLTSNPSGGCFRFDGEAISVSDNGYTILAEDVPSLEFLPDPNENGQEYAIFTFNLIDQSDAQSESATITINVEPVSDAPVVTNTPAELEGEVIEAGHNSDDGTTLIGVSVITGQLSAENLDEENGDELTWSIVGDSADDFGEISIDSSTGEWTYTLDNNKTSVQSLFNGDVKTSSFAARVVDQDGLYVDQTIDVTIRGSDDLIRQYADHVVAFSSAGQDNGGDRWAATQALGEPNTTQYGDLDTAWSPNRRNASGGNQADEFLAVGFRRPVKATGFVIHENYGNGFVRRIEAIDLDGNTHELWQGEDDSPNNLTGFSVILDQPTDYLVKALKVWVDIDHSGDWEEIDAIELIGWTAEETYKPLAPTLDSVAGNNVINAAEKAAGLTLAGQAEANSTVELSWGGLLHTASVGLDRNWSLSISSDDIPSDSSSSSISLVVIDSEGYRSSSYIRAVRINSATPASPEINAVAGDYRINAYEKSVGVVLQGLALGCAQVEINWDGNSFAADVQDDGSWSVLVGGSDGTGAIPDDSLSSTVRVVGIDSDGNRSNASERHLEIDTNTPASPSLATVATDNVINASEKSQGISLNGQSELGATVRLDWGGRTYTGLADSEGNWSVSLPSDLVPADDRSSAITLRAIDVAGNQSILTRSRVSIDTAAPDEPVIAPLSDDDILNSAEVSQSFILEGTSERNSLVDVTWNGYTFTTKARGSGRWELNVDPSVLPANGSISTITASAADAAGNRSGTSSRAVTIDTASPNAPTLNPVGQSGVVNAALISAGLVISGQAEAGATLKLEWELLEKQVTVLSSGEWSIPISRSQVPRDGITNVIVSAIDQAGNISSPVMQSVVVDSTPPRVPNLHGKLAGDGLLTAAERESGLVISGTSEAGTSVDVTFAGLTRTAGMTGTRWQVAFDKSEIPVVEDQKQIVGLIARDTAGNVSDETNAAVVLKTTPPASPLIDVVGSAKRVNAAGKAAGVVVSGQAVNGVDRIELTWGQKTHSVLVSRGRWSVKLAATDVPVDGASTITAVAIAGDVRSTPSSQTIAIDTVAPNVPTLNAVGQSSVVNAALKSAGLPISGQAEAGSTISVAIGRLIKQTTTSVNGIWSLLVSTAEIPQDGSYNLSVTATDFHGNSSLAVIQNVLIDSVLPKAPVLDAVAEDDIISVAERVNGITLTGRAEAGSSVAVDIGGVTRNVVTQSSGRWSLQLNNNELPSSGLVTDLRVAATDAVGNQSAETRKQIVLAYAPASAPIINSISVDNIVNASEARAFSVEGTGDVGSDIVLTIGSTTQKATVDQSGRWSLSIKANQIPSIDGSYQLVATASNRSGLASVAANRSVIIDRSAPDSVSATVEGASLSIDFSEAISASAVSPNQFSVKAGRTSLPIQSIGVDPTMPSRLVLQLASSPAAATDLSISYEPSQRGEPVSDLAGNSLARIRGVAPTTFKSIVDVVSLAGGYRVLQLTGSGSVKAIGNRADNTIVGNIGDNVISGGLGADVLTGLAGRDRFLFASLGDSLLGPGGQQRFDRITDYAIGTDVIDGPSAVARGQVSVLSSVTALDSSSLAALLTAAQFKANGAAVFSFNTNASQRWFVALNDNVAGFDAARDALVEITGFAGQLGDLQIA